MSCFLSSIEIFKSSLETNNKVYVMRKIFFYVVNFKEEPNIVAVVLIFIGVLLLNLAIGFGICVGCTYLACIFFGFNWSIEFAAGCFFIMVMIWWFVTSGRG